MKFEHTETWGIENAIRGMRNPMNSWEQSDSFYGCKDVDNFKNCEGCDVDGKGLCRPSIRSKYYIGKQDLKLAQSLIKAGSEHRKFLRQIFVSADITAPLYWWKEFDTYKVGTTSNSTSTMHKLATTPITWECFETDDERLIKIPKRISITLDSLTVDCEEEFFSKVAKNFIESLEILRQQYIKTKDKRYWKELIRWLPESWLQTRTVTMDYENVYTMIRQRKNHKLNEWSGKDNPALPNFISWARTLPYVEELLFVGLDDKDEEKG